MRVLAMKPTICVLLALCLTACEKPVAQSAFERGVVGPDLSATGPFTTAHEIVLTELKPEGAPMQITITRGPEDVAILDHVVSDTKTYLAGVTYQAFLPIVAETNAERKDYWIVGLNLTRTPDRSVYTILRFPHDQLLTPGTTSDAFEYLTLTCDDLDVARLKAYTPTDADGKPAGEAVSLSAVAAPEAGACEFNSLTEASGVVPVVFNHYDRLKHAEDAPHLDWQPVHVEIH